MFNKMITRLLPVMPKKLVWIFSKKYIAGETLDDAIRVCRELNAMKIRFTLDLLGEFITRLDEEVCYRNIREIVAKAASYNNFIRIDMEDSQCTDKEITLFRRLKAEFPRHVGLVDRPTSTDRSLKKDIPCGFTSPSEKIGSAIPPAA